MNEKLYFRIYFNSFNSFFCIKKDTWLVSFLYLCTIEHLRPQQAYIHSHYPEQTMKRHICCLLVRTTHVVRVITTCVLLIVTQSILSRNAATDNFVLVQGQPLTISHTMTGPTPMVKNVLGMLSDDIGKVLGSKVKIGKKGQIIVNVDSISFDGKKEAFRLEVRKSKLYVTGSDPHGVAYGLLEISRMIGVSPWEWWTDAKPAQLKSFSLPSTFVCQQSPTVEYRGIFINDEDWGLMPWACQTHEPGPQGQIGPRTHERIFQLMLRLRANTYWPAMHECTHPFFLTEDNREMAERYGIYIGGSHCEPMACSTAGEWPLRGKGDYDYVNNSGEVYKFWENRVKEVAQQPILYTIGMRGVHDGAMQGAKTVSEQKAVLEKAMSDQRYMLSQYVNKDITRVPQVFIPYKEVLDIYNAGLNVPEDVCLMWTDDNYGYIRHFPTDSERQRQGGNGIYYHVSYWGRPHDYLWLGTFSPALLFQQMNTAYDRGIQKIWILNVGDIKPAEYQMEMFLDMAWNIHKVRQQGVSGHLNQFLMREFGKEAADRLLPVMLEHYRLAFIHKPEFLGGTRTEEKDRNYWNTIHDLPWDSTAILNRLTACQHLEDAVERIASNVLPERFDCYFQLVKYPVQAAAEMNKKYLFAQFARHGLADWSRSDAAHDSIASLTRLYNSLNGGKWYRMMNCQPRQLSVFNPVPHVIATSPMPVIRKPLQTWNATECTHGNFLPCEALGYEGKAAYVPQGHSIYFDYTSQESSDSILIEVHLLPTHPIAGTTLRIQVSIDQSTSLIADFATHGRSEEWKENVLWNKSVRQFVFSPVLPGNHQIEFKAIDEGIVIDQLLVF